MKRLYPIAVLVVALAWFAGLEYRGLFQPDEGRYAEIPREMLASGDWVTPRLNDLKYFEKPPLQYWATAAIFALFGEDEWTARLWPALCGFAGLLLLAFAGHRLGPPGGAPVAALVLASSWAYFLSSQYLTLDMGLTFFMTATLVFFLLAQAERKRRWMLLAWAAMAGAVLTKGFVGIVLPGLVLAAHLALSRDWGLVRRLEWRWGATLFAALTLPWFIAVQLRNPEFFDFFVLREHFTRFLSAAEHRRPGPWWYFLPILLVGMMPWTPLLPGAVARAWRSRDGVDRLLLLWVGVVLVFFSFSASKLPAYILPAMPALALLIGRDVARSGSLHARWPALVTGIAGAAAFAFVLPWIGRLHELDELIVAYVPWFCAAALVLVIGGLAAATFRSSSIAGATLAVASLGAMQLALLGLHHVDEHYSTEEFAERFLGEGRSFAPAAPFYSVASFDESMPFYLGRTMTLVAHRGELAPGIAAEPQKYIESVDEFRRRWLLAQEAYATMRPQLYAELRESGLPMRLLAIDRRRVIVARHGDEPPAQRKPQGKVMLLARALRPAGR